MTIDNTGGEVLLYLKLIPLIGIGLIIFIPAIRVKTIRIIGLISSLLTFLLSLKLWILFDSLTSDFQLTYQIALLPSENLGGMFNLSFGFGVDGLNLWLIILTTFLTPISLLANWQQAGNYSKHYSIIFLTIEVILLIAFSARDVLVFYLFFEAVLIPFFLLIGIFGSKPRNIRAAYKVFIFTLVGSLPMLVGILIVYFECGSLDWEILSRSYFSPNRQIILWILWFISFGVKTPLVPLHNWLPETHTNAPTGGSIVLAGILLKLGTYGFLRWSLTLFPFASVYFSPFVYLICLIGIVYVSLITLRQIDIKKVIAYSSIAHMSCCILGMFSFNTIGLEGSLLMMVGHGIISPGLFLCAGLLYDRHKTRIIHYYGGLARTMPVFSIMFFILTMANLGLPIISATFVAEFLILTSIFLVNKLVAILATTTICLTGAYAIFLYVRICFGNLKMDYISNYCDLNRREFAILSPFVLLSILIGISPDVILEVCHTSLAYILICY